MDIVVLMLFSNESAIYCSMKFAHTENFTFIKLNVSSCFAL